jgi:hypothetical protein
MERSMTMTVKQLRERLRMMDDDTEVVLSRGGEELLLNDIEECESVYGDGELVAAITLEVDSE